MFTFGAALRRGAAYKLVQEHEDEEFTEDLCKRLLDNRQSLKDAGKKLLGLTGTDPHKEIKDKKREAANLISARQ